MRLNDLSIKNAKPAAKLTKLSDGNGLRLWIFPDGAKRWRWAYRFGGKQKELALGVYPQISLKEARAARDDARRLLASGVDPVDAKKAAKEAQIAQVQAAADTFAEIAKELIAKKRREGRADVTVEKSEWLLSLAMPNIGTRPIRDVTAPDVLAVLRPLESKHKLETARRLRATIGQVFRYAVATGRADGDPTGALRGAIAAPAVKHRAATIEPKAFGALLRAVAGCQSALKNAPSSASKVDPPIIVLLASTRGGAAGQGCGAGARAGSSGRDLVRRGV